MKSAFILFIISCTLFSCHSDDDNVPPDKVNETLQKSYYFPPVLGGLWENESPTRLNWDLAALQQLDSFHTANNSRAFIMLHKGKIVVDSYKGNTITNNAAFTADSKWYWASAGKSLSAVLVGIAQEKGLLNINNKSSDYLGKGWTNAPTAKENLILVKHQLSQSTGMNYQVADLDCTLDSCLTYGVDAGNQWFYHNATHTLLGDVIAAASGITYNQFTDNELETKIGMDGTWIQAGYNKVYWSNARDAARFGLLMLAEGKWKDEAILNDRTYFNAMTNSSQNINPSYGYLWWLNGKSSVIYPT